MFKIKECSLHFNCMLIGIFNIQFTEPSKLEILHPLTANPPNVCAL